MGYEDDYSGTDFNRASGKGRVNARLLQHLFDAARQGDSNSLTRMITASPDVLDWTDPENDDKSLLMTAAEKGHLKACIGLVMLAEDTGHSIDATSRKGSTALMLAAFNGHDGVVSFLVERDADIHLSNNQGVTPLMAAAWSGSGVAVSLLIDNGADINAVDTQGMNAILYAAQNGHTTLVKLLHEAGADHKHISNDGMDLAAAAEASESIAMARLAATLSQKPRLSTPELTAKDKPAGDFESAAADGKKQKKHKKPDRAAAQPEPAPEKTVKELANELQESARETVEKINAPKENKPKSNRLSDLNRRLRDAGF